MSTMLLLAVFYLLTHGTNTVKHETLTVFLARVPFHIELYFVIILHLGQIQFLRRYPFLCFNIDCYVNS